MDQKVAGCYRRDRQTDAQTDTRSLHRPCTAVEASSVDNLILTSHTHTHTFNGPLSGTARVSRYQKGKTNLDFTEARDSEWQWHQLGRMQTICTSLQTDNHASTSPLSFLQVGCPSAAQPTASEHRRQQSNSVNLKHNPNQGQMSAIVVFGGGGQMSGRGAGIVSGRWSVISCHHHGA